MAEWVPESREVADLAVHRTTGDDGLPTGDFSASTPWSAAQVAAMSRRMSLDVLLSLGGSPTILSARIAKAAEHRDDLPEPSVLEADLQAAVRNVAAIGVVAQLELQHGDQGASGVWWDRYQAALARLISTVEDITQEDLPGEGGVTREPPPDGWFPEARVDFDWPRVVHS